MKILLDTNILIHREASIVIKKEIGILFNWFDRLHYEKCIHPLSIQEIEKHKDPAVVNTIKAKLKNYNELKTQANESAEIQRVREQFDKDENDFIDTSLLKEVFNNRVNFLITEDRKIHNKAKILSISERVFTIDDFLEKVTAENPDLADYRVLSVKKEYFGNINLSDPFFDSLKRDYQGFENWFNKKSDEIAYLCRSENNEILAFLYVKAEDRKEDYTDINPALSPKFRLKIGTFKVVLNGFKLGERFIKIIFDNALRLKVDEIYVTIFDKDPDQQRLILLLEDWGFSYHGIKDTKSGQENVYIRDCAPNVDKDNPCLSYPFMSTKNTKFIVPIYPAYHTELFPDSILRTESADDFIENKPNRNAIRKVYISRSIERDLSPGDIIVFYRTRSNGPAHYTAVTTTIGVVQNIITGISNQQHFINLCRKRSVFSDEALAEHWNYSPYNRPFVVNFLYVCSFPKRLNLMQLKEKNIISDAPRGFERLSDTAFKTLMEESNANYSLIVN